MKRTNRTIRKQAAALYIQGRKNDYICSVCGISMPTLVRIVRRAGLCKNKQAFYDNAKVIGFFVCTGYYKKKEIAEIFRVSRRTIYNVPKAKIVIGL